MKLCMTKSEKLKDGRLVKYTQYSVEKSKIKLNYVWHISENGNMGD